MSFIHGLFKPMILRNAEYNQHLTKAYPLAGGDDYVGLMALLQKIDVLIHGVRRPQKPVAVICRNGRREHVQAALFSPEVPPLGGT